VAAGETHSAALSTEGRCFTWGHGGSGRLGHGAGALGEPEDVSVPKEVAALKTIGKGGDRIVTLAAGSCHTVALSGAGKLFIAKDADQWLAKPEASGAGALTKEARRKIEIGLYTHAGWEKPTSPGSA